MRTLHLSSRATCLVAAGIALSAAGAGRADTKVIAEVTTGASSAAGSNSSGPDTSKQDASTNSPSPQTVTVYYQGKKARREVNGGKLITLYDTEANKVYMLFPNQKTYAVMSTKDAFKWLDDQDKLEPPTQTAGLPSGLHQETSVDIDETGLKQNLIGKETQKYTLEASLRMVRDSPSRSGGGSGGFGRGHRHGGGFPGGGGNTGGDSGSYPGGTTGGRGAMSSTQIEGEYWLADAGLLPAGAKSPVLPLLEEGVPAPGILKALNAKLTKLSRIPLSSRVTVTPSAFNGSSGSPVVITIEVTSITEGPLDSTLFQVPADYQKLTPDAAIRQNHAVQSADGK